MKKILISWLIITSLFLTSCGNETNTSEVKKNNSEVAQNQEPLTWGGSTVKPWNLNKSDTINDITKENTVSNTEKKDTVKKEKPIVYMAFASDTFKKEVKDKEHNVFVDNNSELAKAADKYFKENVGKEISIYNKLNGQTVKRKIRRYAPVIFFNAKEKSFDHDVIKKENPELITDVKTDKWDFFFFNTTAIGLPTEYMQLFPEEIKEIKEILVPLTENGKDDKVIILIEDIMNPNSAKDLLSDKTKEILDKNNVSLLLVPVVWKNATKITNFLLLNKKDGKIDKELLEAMLLKQKDIVLLDIEDWKNIIEIIKPVYPNAENLKTWNLEDPKLFSKKDTIKVLNDSIRHVWAYNVPEHIRLTNDGITIMTQYETE